MGGSFLSSAVQNHPLIFMGWRSGLSQPLKSQSRPLVQIYFTFPAPNKMNNVLTYNHFHMQPHTGNYNQLSSADLPSKHKLQTCNLYRITQSSTPNFIKIGIVVLICINYINNFHSGICHTSYVDCLLVRSGWNSILISLADSQHNWYDKYLLLRIQY